MTRRAFRFGLFLLFLLGSLLRLHQLGEESLWMDEICHAKAVALPSWQEMYKYDFTVKPLYTPLNDSLMRACGLKASMGEFAWRLPSMILGSLSILLLGLAVRAMFGPVLGLASAAALALSPYHIWKASQEVNVYGLLSFALVAAVLSLVSAFERGRTYRWVLFSLCVALMLYSHTLSAFMGCWLSGWACLYAGWRLLARDTDGLPARSVAFEKACACSVAVGTAGLMFFPWFVTIGLQAGRGQGGNWQERDISKVLPVMLELVAKSTPSIVGFLLLCAIGLAALWRYRNKWVLFVYGWLLMGIPVFAVSWFNRTMPSPQYQLITLVALCIFAAEGALAVLGLLAGLANRMRKRATAEDARQGAAIAFIACILLLVVFFPELKRLHEEHPRKEPWRQMAMYLGENASEDDVVVCSPPWSFFCMEYYQARLARPLNLLNWDKLTTLSKEDEQALRNKKGRLWYVTRGNLPKDRPVEGSEWANHAVHRYKDETLETANLAAAGEEMGKRGGDSDLNTLLVARTLDARKEYQKVIELLEPRMEKPVSRWEMLGILGKAYEGTKQTQKAIDAFLKYAPHSDNQEYWEYRAVIAHVKAGDNQKALEAGKAFIAKYPNDKLIYYELGRCADAVGDRDTACSYFIQCTRLQDDNAYAFRCAGICHFQNKELDEAEKAFRKCVTLERFGYPDAYMGLAQALWSKGDKVAAKAALREGVEATWNPMLVDKLAKILVDEGDRKGAVDILKGGLQKFPTSEALKGDLKTLESGG